LGKRFKYIAVILLLIVAFPVIYQPVHIIQHNSHNRNDCSSGFCHAGEKPGLPIVQENGHCLICEYEFTVTDQPVKFNISFEALYFNELNPAKVQNLFSFDVILHTSPRAPPFLC